ncbi:MAG: ABC transporter substrate-binding protein [Thermoprotei archaeon]|nr:MAG: ABC transporter substrate-binding protein [Thermoprotei archaeon]
MNRRKFLMILGVVAMIIVITLVFLLSKKFEEGKRGEGLLIVSTFPSLAFDIGQLAEPDDKIVSLIPEGVDPHEYQLTPEDISVLRSASMIVSTAHTSFEVRIRELAESGEIPAVLIEITSIPGIKIKTNPSLNTPNYHTPIYDPENYKIFIRYLGNRMAELRPGKGYIERSRRIIREIDRIVAETPKVNLTAAALTPLVQYAIEWTGIRVKYLLMKEHEVPVTPGDIIAIEEAAKRGEINIIVSLKLDRKTAPALKIEELALKYGLRIIEIPSPLDMSSIPAKLRRISEQVKAILVSH